MDISIERPDEKQAYEEFLQAILKFQRVENVDEYYKVTHEIILRNKDKTKILHRFSTLQNTITHK